MPFDMEKGNGNWKISKHSDNLKEVLMKLGAPAEAVDNLIKAEYPVEMKASGNTFSLKNNTLGKTSENTYTLGVECEETDPNGIKRKVTHTIEGDTLVTVYPNHDGKGLVVRQVRRWIDDNTLRTEYKIGDLEGWTEMVRV